MQLEAGGSTLRRRLSAAAGLLLAAGAHAAAPGLAHAQAAGDAPVPPAGGAAGTSAAASHGTPAWQLDTTLLLYGEQDRAKVAEPVARITRLFGGGQTLSAQFGYDSITGASPSGALPSGQLQTITTPSGTTQTTAAGTVPTVPFKDTRWSADLNYGQPLGRLTTVNLGTHYSKESDYKSLGGTATFSVEAQQRLTTITFGGGYNHDEVAPIHGTPLGLSDGTVTVTTDPNPKNVTSGMLGVSRIVSRTFLLGVTASGTSEKGYLTEPYKIISLVDPVSNTPNGQVTEKRPDSRMRWSVYANSAYHLTEDVIYLSYRHYWDDWSIRSNTFDLKLHHELAGSNFLLPHLRYYQQDAAEFYVSGLYNGQPLPEYASSDLRLGPLKTFTAGLTYGFHPGGSPGTFTIRGEYMRQWGGPKTEGGEGGEGEGGGDDGAGQFAGDRAGPTSVQAAQAVPSAIPLVPIPAYGILSLIVGYSLSF